MPGGGKRWTRDVPGPYHGTVLPLEHVKGQRGADVQATRFYGDAFVDDNPDLDSVNSMANAQGAMRLDGAAGFLYESTSNTVGMGLGSDDFTFDMWAYRWTTSGSQYIFRYGTSMAFDVLTSGADGVTVYCAAGNVVLSASGSNQFPLKTWTHIAVVRQGTSWKMYSNGTQVASATYSYTYTTPPTTLYWGQSGSSSSWFNGRIGNMRLARGVARWTSTFTPPRRRGLVQMLPGQEIHLDFKADVSDCSVQKLQAQNSLLPYTQSKRTQGRAWVLDGSGDAALMRSPYGSVWFSGSSADALVSPATANLDLGSSDFTIDVWAYWTTVGDATFGGRYGVSSDYCWRLWYSSGMFGLSYSTDGTNWQAKWGSWTPTARKWYHLAAVRSGTTLRIFIDGVQLGTDGTVSGALYTPSTSLRTRWGISFATNHLACPRITIGTALWTGTSFAVPTRNDYAVTTYTKSFLPFREAFFGTSRQVSGFDAALTDWSAGVAWAVSTTSSYQSFASPFTAVGSGDWTAEAWVYRTASTGSSEMILSKVNGAGGNTQWAHSWAIGVNASTAELGFWWSTNGTTLSGGSFGVVPPNNKWFHFAVQRASDTLYAFMDGKLIYSSGVGTGTLYVDSGMPMVVGGAISGTDYSTINWTWYGEIMNARFTPKKALYPTSAPFAPPPRLRRKEATTALMDASVEGSYSEYFDSSDSVQVNSHSDFSPGTGPFTIDAWYHPLYPVMGSESRILSSNFGGSGGLGLRVRTDDTLELLAGTSQSVRSRAIIKEVRWYHVAVVRAGTGAGQTRMYVDGVEVSYMTQSAITENITSATYMIVGLYTGTGMYLKHVRFHREALWAGPFTPPRAIADYRCLDSTRLWFPFEYNTKDYGFTGHTETVTGATLNRYCFTGTGDTLDGGYGNATLATRMPRGLENATTTASTRRVLCVRRGGGLMFGKECGTGTYEQLELTQNAFAFSDGAGVKYIQMADSADWYFGTGDFTIHLWFVFTGTSYPRHLFAQGAASDDNNFAFRLSIISSTQLKWSAKYSSAEEHAITASRGGVTLNDGQWHHVAIVRSGTTTTVYIDGVSGGSETSSGEYRDNANSLTVGDKWALSTERFSPGALSTMEIVKGRALWTASFTPPTLREDFLHYDSVLTLTADWVSDHYDNQVQDQAKQRSITFSLYNSLYGTYRGGPVYPFIFGSQDFTVDCWVRRGTYSQGSDQNILTFYGDSTSLYALRIISAPTYIIKAQVHDGTTEYSLTNYYSSIPQMWSHLALVRSGTTIALYLDGVQIATQTVAANYTLRKVQGGCFGSGAPRPSRRIRSGSSAICA